MSAPTLDASDLLKALGDMQEISDGTAQVTLQNATPSGWGVTIVLAGCKFFYRDGTDYTDGPKRINLKSGQTHTFISDDPKGCVGSYFIAMTVHVKGEGAKDMVYSDSVKKGECLLHHTVTLGPKDSVAESDLKKSTVDKLELSRE